jgi:hypothetical protein
MSVLGAVLGVLFLLTIFYGWFIFDYTAWLGSKNPTTPDLRSGYVYPLHMHGTDVYLTEHQSQLVNSGLLCFVVTFVLMLIFRSGAFERSNAASDQPSMTVQAIRWLAAAVILMSALTLMFFGNQLMQFVFVDAKMFT